MGEKKKLKSQNTFVFSPYKKGQVHIQNKANIKLTLCTTIQKIPVDILNAGLANNKRCTKWTHQCQISFIVIKEYNFSHMEKL